MKPIAVPRFSAETIVRGGALVAVFAAAVLIFAGASCTSRGPETRKPDPSAQTPAAEPQPSEAGIAAKEVLVVAKKLENVGKFQEAYDTYSVKSRDEALRATGQAADVQLADILQTRTKAMRYLAPASKVAQDESLFWKPKNDADLEEGRKELYTTYETYRHNGLVLAKLGMEAAKVGQSTNDQAAYDAKVGEVMDAFVVLVTVSNQYHLATYTFQQLREGILYMTGANREWDNIFQRKNSLVGTSRYFEAAKERFEMTKEDPGADNFWPR